MDISVSNLTWAITTTDLERLFSKYGALDRCQVITDKRNGRSLGYAYLTMPNNEEAHKAIDKMNHTLLHGNVIIVQHVPPRGSRKQRFRSNWKPTVEAVKERMRLEAEATKDLPPVETTKDV